MGTVKRVLDLTGSYKPKAGEIVTRGRGDMLSDPRYILNWDVCVAPASLREKLAGYANVTFDDEVKAPRRRKKEE